MKESIEIVFAMLASFTTLFFKLRLSWHTYAATSATKTFAIGAELPGFRRTAINGSICPQAAAKKITVQKGSNNKV